MRRSSRIGIAWFLVLVPLGCSRREPLFEKVILDSNGPRDCWTKSTGDLDGDGRPDLVAGGHASGGLFWYENGTFKRHPVCSLPGSKTDAEIVDLDRDGDADVLNLYEKAVAWFENPSWTMHPVDSAGLHDVEAADFDGDGWMDAAARNQAEFGGRGDTLFVFRRETAGRWSRFMIPIPNGEGLKAVDVNRDNRMDLVINGIWLENTGDVRRWVSRPFTDTWTWRSAYIDAADINGDGRTDIVLAPSEPAGRTYRMSWFEAPLDPTSAWKEHVVATQLESVLHFVGVADFNRDGAPDIATAEMEQGRDPDEICVYFQRGPDRWRRTVVGTGGSHSMRIVDADWDGAKDLFGANWQGGEVHVWLNRCGSQKGL